LIKKTAAVFTNYLHKDKFDVHSNQRQSLPHFFEFLSYLDAINCSDPAANGPTYDLIFIHVFTKAEMIYGQLGGTDGIVKAIQYGKKALYLTKFYYGENNVKYVKALVNLASAFSEMQGLENLGFARTHYEEGIRILSDLPRVDGGKPDYKPELHKGICYRGIGLCYFNEAIKEGNSEKKDKLLRLAIEKYILSIECHNQCASTPNLTREYMLFRTNNNIALAYWRLGDIAKAVECYKNLLSSRAELRGKNGESVDGNGGKLEEAIVRVNLGMCQYDLGQYSDGADSLKVIKELEDAFANHAGRGLAYYYLGLCMLRSQADGVEAISHIEQGILIVRERVFSPEHAFVSFLQKEFTVLKRALSDNSSQHSLELLKHIDEFECWIDSYSLQKKSFSRLSAQ
jgi:tetratricopeptide (TPR) repeat protein